MNTAGSPPPMRGKATEKYNGVSKKGITPAYAGKSKTHAGMSTPAADHPRLCGEKHIINNYILKEPGSPPPMRGKDKHRFRKNGRNGITPAYAGKSPTLSDVHEVSRDHPRLCGEKLTHAALPFDRLGSPPPMRGKVVRHTHTQDRFRITPAYAGKSGIITVEVSYM